MFHDIAASASRLLTKGLPLRLGRRRKMSLHIDELSEHMLRDLGLADGHRRPFEAPETAEVSRSAGQERLVITPVAS